jgi:DNA helicase-4
MKVRIGGELNEAIEIRTFHSLGLKILEKNKEEYFKLQENDKKKIYSNFFKHLKNEGILKNIIEFFSFYKDPILDISSFEKLGDYFDEIKVNLETLKSLLNEKETIQDEKVKSLEELMIANFLFYNGVKYEYEKEYEYNTKTKEYKNQYKPDFYLIDSKIYLEHFGITRDNRVPIVGKDQKKEKRYLSGKKWKINLHEEKGTRLLQTFSYFHTEGRLLEELEEMLLRNGVKLTPLTTEELKKLYSKLLERKKLKSVKELFEIFLNLYKSNNYLEKDIEKVFSNGNSKKSNQRMELFKKIFKEFYKFYEKEKGNKIDFTDMIINSKNMIKTDKAKLNYDYIIIDEYQDTSKDRFELIKAIQDKCNSKIMAVGDDWQSIYRFSGSDISLFIDFEKMFGQTKELKIEQTYRNSQELIKVASKFIQKNNLQKKKKLKSEKRTENPVVKVEYIDKEIEKFDWKTSQKEAVKYIIDNLLNNISNAKECSLMLIGRNNKDIDFLDSEEFKIEKNKDKVNVIYRENKNPRMKINFETVHKAKGLEADNVIILNCKNDYLGFPNKISDDPILDLLLAKKEVYPHAEERRLFYVALTRTKNKVFLLTPRFNPSIFLRELEALEYSLDLEGEENFYKNCPVCKTGNLVKREGYSTFYGCTNYPMCKPNINLEEYIKIK